jgi:hypothetical protein
VRALAPFAVAGALLLAAPGAASADVVFDPADADDLAATLAEATQQQDVCYGWHVTVQDVATTDESVGSNLGANKAVSTGSCRASVEFTATITYTSESSEAEDSASYDVSSNPGGVSRADFDALGIDMGGLTGEDPDVAIGKAVAALPLLAADKGLADPIQAAPQTATSTPADARLTDDPGSDWWRRNGGTLLWGLSLIVAGGLFAWWVVRSNRRRTGGRKQSSVRHEPPTEPVPVQKDPPTAPVPVQAAPPRPAEPAADEPAGKSAADEPAPPSDKDVVPPNQKDKE